MNRIKLNGCLLIFAFFLIFSCKSSEKDKVVFTQSQGGNEHLLSSIEKDNLLGKINNHLITYDYQYMLSDVHQIKYDDKLIIYSLKGEQRSPLLTFDFNGYQKLGVYLIYMQKYPFIYITTSHTYGHFCGYFYAIDIEKNAAKNVDLVYDKGFKENRVLNGLEFYKQNGLLLDKHNNITSGDYYRDKEGNDYIYQCLYKLIKIKNNTYKLKLVKSRMD